MAKSIYTDKNGNIIEYGDILKYEEPIIQNRDEFSPEEPQFKLEIFDGKPMIHISGMDEYQEINECQSPDDEPATLKHFIIVRSCFDCSRYGHDFGDVFCNGCTDHSNFVKAQIPLVD